MGRLAAAAWIGLLDATPRPRQRLPRVLQFPVNDVCNSRCQMCLIWQRKRDREVTPAEVRRALASPLFRKLEVVGLNGGEPTLRRDLGEVAAAVVETLPRLRGIGLITNAILPRRVKAAITEVAEVCRDGGVGLDVMVSLDGVGEVHDRVRGRPGNFAAAVEVLDWLQGEAPVESCRIGCTVVKENVYDLENVLDWCERRDLYARFRVGIPHRRLYSLDVVDPFALDAEELFHLANFLDVLRLDYERDPRRRSFYRSLRDQLVYGAPRAAGCRWKSAGATLTARGELAFCAVESDVLGSAVDGDPAALYWGRRDHLREIVEHRCADCRHDYEGDASRRTYLRFVAERLLQGLPRPAQGAVVGTLRAGRSLVEGWRVARAGGGARPAVRGDGPPRVLLCGWYGTETLGDRAILGGVVECLRAARPDAVVELASLEPYVSRHTAAQMPELGVARVVSLAEARRDLGAGRYRAAAVAGGPLMTGVAEVVDLAELFALARRGGARTLVAGCGVGPVAGGVHHARRRAIARLLAMADGVVLRDTASAALARRLAGRDLGVEVVLDPAFLWLEAQLGDGAPPPSRRRLGLALRDWPIDQYAGGLRRAAAERLRARFDGEVARLVTTLQERHPELEVVPLCMNKLAAGGDDRRYYRRVLRDFPELLARLDSRHRPPGEELAAFRSCGAVLAMRFHSLVFALAAGTPAVVVDYTRGGKIPGLLADVGGVEVPVLALAEFDGAAAAELLVARLGQAASPPRAQIAAGRAVLTAAWARLLAA